MIIGRRIAALLVAAVAAAACSTSVAGSPAPEGAAPADAGSGGESATVDACTLLTSEEIQAATGWAPDTSASRAYGTTGPVPITARTR